MLVWLDAVESEDQDVVLLDVGPPEMSGIDVLHRFREANSLTSVGMLPRATAFRRYSSARTTRRPVAEPAEPPPTSLLT